MTPQPLPWLFPYVREIAPEAHELGFTVLRPLVEARLIGPRNQEGQKVAALVDSGSSYTLAFDWMAQEVGIDLDPDRRLRLRIAGAPRTVLFADAQLRLCPPGRRLGGQPAPEPCGPEDGLQWSTEVGFIKDWADPPWSMLLGQRGFLDEFTVVMSRASQALAVEPVEHFDDQYGVIIEEAKDDPPRRRV